ncbi:acetolactate synthase [Coniochaeta ligniaria NRRL 30616]|uniref:Acetolactate synthase n=1 Tax=Coniochaeta ligniaria NRRL 30616 TaxID=1408157 RepID=A0A1J7K3S6_9PEZI|nr:acetolactate synthase [Coniochaeta ligniaria NRRL 30616]
MTGTETVQIAVDSLLAAGVKYVFGVPGAKIDSLFNALLDHPEIRLVVCRHEQNAAFIAGAVGKLTGRPGVCIVTSGPGTSNLVTGLVTANDEGMPLVAIAGTVKRVQAAKRTHQSLRASELLAPVTKKVVAVVVADQVAELMLDAFRVATTQPQGATAISLPIDVMTAGMTSAIPAFPASAFRPPEYGSSPEESLRTAARMIEAAKFPVLFLGARAADRLHVEAVHAFLRKFPVPVVETFQAAGAISKELVHLFFGRVGLFRNQPGDKIFMLLSLLRARADLVIAVGYDQAEYDANQWNPDNRFNILHLDFIPADIGHNYSPKLELIGSPAANIQALTKLLTAVARPQDTPDAKSILADMHSWESSPEASPNPAAGGPVQPLHFIKHLQSKIDTTTTVACDVGSVYIYFSRYFYSYAPKTFLVSNAQQTLGVALPWAIAASLCQTPRCSRKVVSVSGDGGFLFSGQELATAVKEGCNITHFVWNDGKYNMVEFQEVDKYGRSAGVDLGGVDFAAYAEAFGALGLRVTSSAELEAVMERALGYEGVCVVDVAIDYSRNHELMANVIADDIL